MQLIDTHAHLYLKQFDSERSFILKRAVDAGVSRVLLPNIDENTIKPMLQVCAEFPDNCCPMMAIHPTSIKKEYHKQLHVVEEQLKKQNFCAVGETGIDLYRDKTFSKEQSIAFEKHIEMAYQYDLPLVIHSRNSLDEIFKILQNNNNQRLRGVFHCFPGDVEQAYRVIELGFMIGIGGVVTYKNSTMVKVAQEIDLEHILLETDAPYLAPVPERGKRNECSYLIYVAEKIADIKKTDIKTVASITSKNALDLFKIS